jgi:hypothetical protein
VAIVHHLFPLDEALEQARAVEKVAKSVSTKASEKNALAIRLCKRGGEAYTISGHWNNLDVYLEKLIKHYRAKRIPKGLPYDLRESFLRLTALRGSGSAEDDTASENTTSSERSDTDHPPQVSHDPLRDTKRSDTLIKVIKADAKRIIERKLKVPKRKVDAETTFLLRLLAGRIGIDLAELDEQSLEPLADAQQPNETKSALIIDGLEDTQHLDLSAFYKVMQIYIHELVIAKELADALTLAGDQPTIQIQGVAV